MKKLLCGCMFIAAAFGAFAGDVAAFVDIGISSDGKTYIFGEYGRTDGDFRGYAEIYTVDIGKNDFVPGGIFRTNPSPSTAIKSGKAVYDELLSKAGWAIRKYECKPVKAENLLYLRDDNTSDGTEIVFKDFEGSSSEQTVFYHARLRTTLDGTRSSFSIDLEKQNEAGTVISRNVVGNPGIKRKDVTAYRIDRIFSDSTGRSLIFVIEKTVVDAKGTSIRYMVETIRL